MGAKQSKRSVDISGKEADGAGEVAAAGAGGEGRVEQLADPDALKAQINGDAHIHESSDKEKELDSGTPENEKDATTEKEGKEPEGEKESTPVTNGEGDQKTENGESTTAEEGKKPKKEKVKKKWSLRSISFSRKDKPKQEKKQKEEESKANGDPEKVPEETGDTTPESPVNEVAEEVKPSAEPIEEKTPETPVTEPITNGSSTPESPKVETPVVEESVVASPEIDRPEPKGETEPEKLPINGLSLEEPIQETSKVESKIEETIENKTETTEVVSVPEIPVIKEVCVTQLPLIEPSPPPLPANPPPSCVASFAATTMAPELTAASLSNTETAITTPLSNLDIKVTQNDPCPDSQTNITNIQTVINDPIPIINKSINESVTLPDNETIDPVLEISTEKLKDDIENIQPGLPEISLSTEEPKTTHSKTDAVSNDCEVDTNNKIMIEAAEMNQKENAVKEPKEEVEVAKTNEIVAIKVTVDDVLQVVNTSLEESAIKVTSDVDAPENNTVQKEAPEVEKLENINTASTANFDEIVQNAELHNSAQHICTTDVEENMAVKNVDINEDDNVVASTVETEAPFSTDSESIIEPVASVEPVLNDIDDLPPPPPPIEDLDTDEKDIATPKQSSTIIPEIIHHTNEADSTDAIKKNKESQEEIAETPKDVKDANEMVQYNKTQDELVTDVVVAELSRMDKADMPKVVENAVLVAEESMPSPLSEEVETTPAEAEGAATDTGSESIRPAGAKACQTEELPPHTPQDPICEKMVDLIPEVPTVPEMKTEVLQETSNDVVVAN